MIKRLTVKNFKCLRDIDIPLNNFNVFIGPNNTGKTSLLDALSFLNQSVTVPFTDYFSEPARPFDKVVWMGKRDAKIELGLTSEEWQYTLAVGYDKAVKTETLASQESGDVIFQKNEGHWNYKGQPIPHDEFLYTFFYFLGEKIADHPYSDLQDSAQMLTNIHPYALKPAELARDSYLAPKQLNNPKLNAVGYGLPSILSIMASTAPDDTRYHKIKKYLRQVFPEISNFGIAHVPILQDLEEAKVVWITGQSLYFELKGSKHRVPASLMSDGVLLVLGYLTLAYTNRPPAILLIEEPENGIHPKLLKFVVEVLRGMSRGLDQDTPPVQIILTTHSPYLLDATIPEEVYIFQKDEGGASTITPMAKVEGIKEWLSEYMLGEFLVPRKN